MDKDIDINAQTKIGELLDAYPQLEAILIELSPSFAKLKNPILRKTVGRIASLRQAADIGGLNVGEMISVLRKAAGMESSSSNILSDVKIQNTVPEWFDDENIFLTFNASNIIERGESPMKDILERANLITENKIMLLITPFIPVPILELLESKGYKTWSKNCKENEVYTYIKK